MQKNIQELSDDMNKMVVNGQLVDAAEKYYASNIRTIEFDGTLTEGKEAAMKKLNEFVGSIKRVKELTLLRSAAYDNTSFSEYILRFEMNDGSDVYMHEIVRSLWESGQVVEEQYFKG